MGTFETIAVLAAVYVLAVIAYRTTRNANQPIREEA